MKNILAALLALACMCPCIVHADDTKPATATYTKPEGAKDDAKKDDAKKDDAKKDDAKKDDAKKDNKPVTFCFNGGPGSSSVWLHLGAFGPKRVDLPVDGLTPHWRARIH